MHRLETFGRLTLTNGVGERPQPRRRLALLARLAPAGARGVSRDELLALFWPERDLETARHSLDQLLYEARRAFGASPTLGTAFLRLDPDVVASDVAEWNAAIERDDLETAVSLYRGPFLHGFYVSASAEFEQWIEATRAQFAADHRRLLETLATRATARGRVTDAVAWWRRLAAEDRLGSRTALGLMRALVDAGDRAGAVEFARIHDRIVRLELETAPDPAVAAFADSLRAPDATHATTVAQPARAASAGDGSPSPVAPRRGRRWASRPARIYAAVAVVGLATASYRALTLAHGHGMASLLPAAPPNVLVAGGRSTRRAPARTTMYATANIAAHDFYERGADPVLLRSDSGVRTAIRYLNRAVALDTNYAAAYAVLSSIYCTAAWGTTVQVSERRAMVERAEAAARRAIALDDSLADGHAGLGYLLMLNHHPTAAVAELERALALDPKSANTRELLSKAYEWTGRRDDAVAVTRLADPLSPGARAELSEALYFARRYDEALAELGKLADLQPQLRRAPQYLGEIYAATGRWSDAIATLRPVFAPQPLLGGLLGYALARSGARAEAKRLLAGMLADESTGGALAWGITQVYVGLGDYDRAFVWLDRSFDDYSIRAEVMGPLFDDFRADPRFGRARLRLGLAR